MNITPGQIVATLFTPAELRRSLGVSRSTCWRWSQPIPKGTGGLIPSRYHLPLLRLAGERGVELTAADLVHGRLCAIAHNSGEAGYNRATPSEAA